MGVRMPVHTLGLGVWVARTQGRMPPHACMLAWALSRMCCVEWHAVTVLRRLLRILVLACFVVGWGIRL